MTLFVLCGCGGKFAPDADDGGDSAVEGGNPPGDAAADGDSGCIPIGATVPGDFDGVCSDGMHGVFVTLMDGGYIADQAGDAGWSCSSASYDGCTVSYTNCALSMDLPCKVVSSQFKFGFDPKLQTIAQGTVTWDCGNCSGTTDAVLLPVQ